MKRTLAIAAMMSAMLSAKVYVAKVEPIDRVTLKAAVGGLVVQADRNDEGRYLNGKIIVQIDDTVDRSERNATATKIGDLEQTVALLKEQLPLLQSAAARQKAYYERLSKLPTASQTQKDNAFNAYVSTQGQYVATKQSVLSLQTQLADLRARLIKLDDTIEKKKIRADGYVTRLAVRRGDVVAPGTPVAVIDDTSKAKLVLFLTPEDASNIARKEVIVDGTKGYRIDKLWKVPDDTYLSSYRAEIVLPKSKKRFGDLVKVEIR